MKTYTSYQNDIQRVINVSDSDTVAYCTELVNDSLRYLTKTFYFNERTFSVPGGTQPSTQWYRLPPNIAEVIDVTVNINGVLWIPDFAANRRYWDALNVITFVQDYPLFFFIWNNQLGLFPMPATTGYPITINYKERITDLTQADYTTGTVSATQYKTGQFTATAASSTLAGTTQPYSPFLQNADPVTLISTGTLPTGFTTNTTYYAINVTATGTPSSSGNPQTYTFQLTTVSGNAGNIVTPTTAGTGQMTYSVSAQIVTGSGTAWSQIMAGQWLKIAPSNTDASSGDGRWYQIQSVNSATSLTLFNEYIGTGSTASLTGASYLIGQVPILNENYQDLPLYRMAVIYYTVRLPDEARAKWFQKLYDDGYEALNKEFGAKTTSPVLLDTDVGIYNPNLFVMNQKQIT